MLSHLRFHRRGPSNPSSPVPDQASPWEQPERPQAAHDASPHPDSRSRSPNPSVPLSLPPIPRVASSDADPTFGARDGDVPPAARDTFSPPGRTPQTTGESGFIGGVALRRAQRAGRQEPSAMGSPQMTVPESQIARAKPPPPPINTNINPVSRSPLVPVSHAKSGSSSFVSPVEMQSMGSFIAGKRPAGTRLMSEHPAPAASSQAQVEAHKAKKGLPFLKNPMSTLLMRRRTGQSSDAGMPVAHGVPEPIYDPRIRGTRVHDFSAPRQPRRIVSNAAASALGARADGDLELHRLSTVPSELNIVSPESGRRGKSGTSMPSDNQPVEGTNPVNSRSGSGPPQEASQISRRLSFEEKPLPDEPLPPVPPKDRPTSSGTLSNKSRAVSSSVDSVAARSLASTRTARSHKVSLSDISTRESVVSAVPKHMKSTSSRFSFDMIGAAKQEKLLEERHRQRELDRKVSDPKPSLQRDSRFDDFDDDFDYDAMMDDDGLEERIPGVNADYNEEDEDQFETGFEDPDNDQENFAGFVFQRSNPQSSLASPDVYGMLVTPRDAAGQPIGYAATKDTTPEIQSATSPTHRLDQGSYPDDDTVAGLGIQGLSIAEESPYECGPSEEDQPALPSLTEGMTTGNDDLYFDEGLMEELNSYEDEIQTGTFDESIFDANDTDKYGRPIPGAFAQAQAALAAARAEEQARRESDMTSHFSAQSGVSESTTRTSLSVGLQRYPSVKEEEPQPAALPQPETQQFIPPTQLSSQDKIAAYQAALAEAAHKAAASGKFRRDSSPSPPPPAADLMLTSPTTGSEPEGVQAAHDPIYDDDYDEDGFGHEDLDDYDFDDEAIIAEANASALANDFEGWYGQEFGFYSAPASQPNHGHGPSAHTRVNSAPLNAQNLFEYANGGYFGPSGVVRSKSGRIVSREPNLTPITERSEYSNRNSIMSLALPPALGSDPRSPSSLQSPGLAQLAMIADDSEMSLSALMKLRNKAWGGSQASLVGSPREGSPRSDRGAGPLEGRDGAISPWSTASASAYLGISGPTSHARKNSNFSLYSRDSDVGSGSGSPTLTMNMSLPSSVPTGDGGGFNSGGAQPVFSPPPPPIPQPSPGSQCPPVMEDEELVEEHSAGGGSSSMSGSVVWMKSPAPTESSHANVLSPVSSPPPLAGGAVNPAASASAATAGPRRPGMGHRHMGSADSISYVKEEDSGETRWVVERRRTGEGGEVEILGREVVEGGRI